MESNIEEKKLTKEMKEIITVITKHLKVTKIPGRLYNIEKHNDAVVTEFAFIYEEIDTTTSKRTYTRYFVVKSTDKHSVTYYMGSDQTLLNPHKNSYFVPATPLNKTQDSQTYS
jgi:hypothetical protein